MQTVLFKNQVYCFTLKGWNSTSRINYLLIHSKREREELATHRIGQKRKVLQEDRMRNLQEMKDLQKLRCTEAERAKHLRIDKISVQERESQSILNHLTFQIQELQDKVNSLSDSREYFMILKLQAVLGYPTFPVIL